MRSFRAAINDAIVSLDVRIYDVSGERPLPMPVDHWLDEAAGPGLRLVTASPEPGARVQAGTNGSSAA
jgi:hypothetical protein